jgi:uncharacterized protein with GYD domain
VRTFILLSTLTPQGAQTLSATPERLLEVNREIEKFGGRVVRQWALLGAYDFMTVIEAPDAQAITRMSFELGSRGSAHFETLTALDPNDFLDIPIDAD